MNISRLISYLEALEDTYGDMEIEGRIVGEDNMVFSGMIVNDNYADGLCTSTSSDRYTLVLELEEYDSEWQPVFNCYEYPNGTPIELPK